MFYKLPMWWAIIGKKKIDVSSGSKWKLVKSLSYQQFI